MGSKITVYLLFYVIIVSISLTDAQFCYSTGKFTANSTYGKNRDLLLHSLASNVTANGGFYYTTIGVANDTVHGLVHCMSSPSAEDCLNCVNSTIQGLIKACPNQKEAFSRGSVGVPCVVRYANRYFFGSLELDPTDAGYNTGILETNLTHFGQIWNGLMADTITRVSMGPFRLGTGKADLTSTQKIYIYMQCTPDISPTDCNKCLKHSVAYYTDCCYGQQGGYVYKPNCGLRWDLYPFQSLFPEVSSASPSPPFIISSPPPTNTSPSPSPPFIISSPPATNTTIKKEKENTASRTVMVTVIPTVIFLALVILSTFTIFRFRNPKKEVKRRGGEPDNTSSLAHFQDRKKEDLEETTSPNLPIFDIKTVTAATDNFSFANKLGQGGFGSVYMGRLPRGQEIAVKRLSKNSRQGVEEFKNEVRLISKLQHKNLVRLFGCCIHKDEKLLVYEYLPNKSLDFFIFDKTRRELLDWSQRFEIILGIARGLLYLHQDSRLKIIHRDLKAGNVLLDAAMNPKISDFGMARIFGEDQTEANTKKVVGTYGYMSPEYAMEGLYSIKSDVFSYGVLVLEIISGRKNNDGCDESPSQKLIAQAWDLWNEGKALQIVDSTLGNSYPTNEVLKCIQVGLLCVQDNPADRPRMSAIVFMLDNETVLPSPNKPTFIIRRKQNDSESATAKGGAASINGVTITKMEGR